MTYCLFGGFVVRLIGLVGGVLFGRGGGGHKYNSSGCSEIFTIVWKIIGRG